MCIGFIRNVRYFVPGLNSFAERHLVSLANIKRLNVDCPYSVLSEHMVHNVKV